MSERGELAKETERAAINLLSTCLAGMATVYDLSDKQAHDFEIHYNDGRRAIGEIGILANPQYESALAAMRTREKQHFVDLPDGYGTWGTHLYGNPNINRFELEVPRLIDELNKYEITQFQVGMHPELRELSQHCEALGIQYLVKHDDYPGNQVVYFLDMGQPIFIDSTLNSLVKCVEAAIFDGNFQDSWKKLEAHDSDEKHLVFRCGSLIPLNHQHVLLTLEPAPEIPDINFPIGITHIWLMPAYLEAPYIYWSSEGEKKFINPLHWNKPNLL